MYGIEFTLSKIMAFMIIFIGTALAFYLKEAAPFEISCGTAAVLMGVKTISDGFSRRTQIKYKEPNASTDH